MGRKWSPVQIRPSRLNGLKEEYVEKIWLKNYPKGVPAEINPDLYQSVADIFETSCQQYAEQPAYYNLGKTITYQQLNDAARDFAASLQQELKLQKGDRIAIMMPNCLQYPIVIFAALRAGLVLVNVNPLYTAPELVHQLNDSGASAIIVIANFAATLQKALPEIPSIKHVIITEAPEFFICCNRVHTEECFRFELLMLKH